MEFLEVTVENLGKCLPRIQYVMI